MTKRAFKAWYRNADFTFPTVLSLMAVGLLVTGLGN